VPDLVDRRISAAFLALVAVQALHSIEEYSFGFYEVFPPARLIHALVPGLPRPGFIVFNTLLVLFGLWCAFSNVIPATGSARDWVWIWVAIELFNGLAHPIWAVAIGGYNPGLATSPALLGLAIYLFHRLRTTPEPRTDPEPP
jgi:hypothetical protein